MEMSRAWKTIRARYSEKCLSDRPNWEQNA